MHRVLFAAAATLAAATAYAAPQQGPQPTYMLVMQLGGETAIFQRSMDYASCRVAESSYVPEADMLTTPQLLDAVRVLPVGARVTCEIDTLPVTAPVPTPRPQFGF